MSERRGRGRRGPLPEEDSRAGWGRGRGVGPRGWGRAEVEPLHVSE
jgi:hypothetical protein